MGLASALFHLAILLAASNDRLRSTGKSISSGSFDAKKPVKNKGRQRYAPTQGGTNDHHANKRQHSSGGRKQAQEQQPPEESILPTIPSLTNNQGPFPTYLTCRHSYEETLVEEITRYSPSGSGIRASVSAPGLVYVEGLPDDTNNFHLWDPVYALQSLPNCRIVESPNSIKGLARAIAEIDDFARLLASAPRGSLSIHALVPGMCKGQKDPIWQRRSHLVTDAILDIWKRQFPAARKQSKQDDVDRTVIEEDALLLQVLLLSPDVAAASLSKCRPAHPFSLARWPNPNYPVGMAQVDITTQKMPSSAYRKLLEAFACGERRPSHQATVVDLGASPGGWTSAVLLYCDSGRLSKSNESIQILAVDRSPLDPKLRKDARVRFIQGDAFSYEPPKSPVDWMVSDIIAYPERIVELVNRWCSKGLAENMIVTIKFQGSYPSWEHIDEAILVAKSNGYCARAKHFFNNKNEVTLMMNQRKFRTGITSGTSGSLETINIPSFYKSAISPAKSR